MSAKIITVDFSKSQMEMVADKLENVNWNSEGGFKALCPAHDDHNPSLSVSEGENGRPIFHCFAGCAYEDVVAVLHEIDGRASTRNDTTDNQTSDGFTPQAFVDGKFMVPNFKKLCGKKPAKVYKYLDSHGRIFGYVARFKNKSFQPITPWQNQNGKTVWKAKGFFGKRPLYGLETLGESDQQKVLIVEGEKTVDAARKLFPDYDVVTWQGGSNAVGKTNWSPLAGSDVTIWPDADEPGTKAAKTIAKVLRQIDVDVVKQVDLPNSLPKSWDVADAVPDGIDIKALLNDAQSKSVDLVDLLLSAKQLSKKKVKKREMIIGPFLPTQSINMMFAKRGIGKTWFGITMAKNIALGKSFLGYEVPKPRRVLFIDGEMPLSDLQYRFNAVGAQKIENLDILASEICYDEFHALNINKEEDRGHLSAMFKKMTALGKGPELIIFDNLSSLRSGVDENDNSALDPILIWAKELRHQGYSVLLVHHANKLGSQRGASRIEDMLDTTIMLERTSPLESGPAEFELTFTKTRGIHPDPDCMKLTLIDVGDGIMDWEYEQAKKIVTQDYTLQAVSRGPAEDGKSMFRNQTELCEKLGKKKPFVSKHIKYLRENKFVILEEGFIKVTAAGRKHLSNAFPDG